MQEEQQAVFSTFADKYQHVTLNLDSMQEHLPGAL